MNLRSASLQKPEDIRVTQVRLPASNWDALVVALGEVITVLLPWGHRLELIMEGKCALGVFPGKKYFHLVLIRIQHQQKGQELIGWWDEITFRINQIGAEICLCNALRNHAEEFLKDVGKLKCQWSLPVRVSSCLGAGKYTSAWVGRHLPHGDFWQVRLSESPAKDTLYNARSWQN